MVVGTLRVATRLQVEFRLHNSVPSRRHAKGTSLLDLLYMYRAYNVSRVRTRRFATVGVFIC